MLQKGFLAAAFLSASTAPAVAGVRLSIVGAGNLPRATAHLNGAPLNLTGKFTYGGGALIEFPLAQRVGLELGGLYFKRMYDADFGASGDTTRIDFSAIEVPIALKFWVHRAFFLSLGGYVSNSFGTVTESDPVSGLSATGTISDLHQRALNYGVLGGLGLNIPLGDSFAIRAEGRYQFALKNSFDDEAIAASSSNTLKHNEVHVLVGLTIGGNRSK